MKRKGFKLKLSPIGFNIWLSKSRNKLVIELKDHFGFWDRFKLAMEFLFQHNSATKFINYHTITGWESKLLIKQLKKLKN